MPKITFVRENRTIEVPEGTNLRQAAMAEGIELYSDELFPGVNVGLKRKLNCHGFGHCGECRVYVKQGMENTTRKTLKERFRIGVSFFKFDHEHEVRLACQTSVTGDLEVYTQPEFNWFGDRSKSGAAG